MLLNENKLNFSELLKSCLDKINFDEGEIHAWQEIASLDKLVRPLKSGPLFGLCMGVKDILSTRDFNTSMGSERKTWQGTEGGFDARVVSKIKEAGATIMGKNKTSEFAVHKPTDTINPRNHKLIPGTSSSGSAAAVAAGHISISLATQTAGSIARPSSYCGVIGFKPTFGQIPRTGVLKTTESFDTVGIIGNSVSNILSVFQIARVSDLNHPTHLSKTQLIQPVNKFYYAIGPTFDNAKKELRERAIDLSRVLVARNEVLDLADYTKIDFCGLRNCHNDIYAKELAYFLNQELLSGEISQELKDFANYGASISNSYYKKSLDFLRLQRAQANIEFKGALIFSLSASNEAPTIGEPDVIDSNLFWTALGLPQISLPILKSEAENPIGLSIIGQRGSDLKLLEFSKQIFSGFVD